MEFGFHAVLLPVLIVLESFANFTEGADTVNLTGAISVDIVMHGDKERPFVIRFGLQVRR